MAFIHRQSLLTCLPRSSSKTLNSPGDPSLASSGQHPDCSWIHLTNEPQSVSLLTNIRNPPHRDQNTLAFNQKYFIYIWAKISTNSPIKYSQFLSTSRSTNKSKSIIIIISDFIEATQQTVNWIFRHPLNHHNESVIIDFHLRSYLPQSWCFFSPSSCSSWATASAPRPEAEILTGTASGTWRGWRGRASPSAATSRRQVRILQNRFATVHFRRRNTDDQWLIVLSLHSSFKSRGCEQLINQLCAVQLL